MYQPYSNYPIHEDLQIIYTEDAYKTAVAYANLYNNLEFMLVPVCGLILRKDVSPLRELELSDVEAIVVHKYIHPPHQINTGAHTGIIQSKRQEVSDLITEEITRLRDEYPRLGNFIKFHAHPFTGGRFLSGGDINANLVGENLQRWRSETGISFVPMQVIWPLEGISMGRNTDIRGGGNDSTWNITTFLHIDNRLHVTPRPSILRDNPKHNSIYKPPFWMDHEGWCVKQRDSLRNRWPEASYRFLGRGWVQFFAPGKPYGIIVTLGPDFPNQPAEIFIVPPQTSVAQFMREKTFAVEDLDTYDLMWDFDSVMRGG